MLSPITSTAASLAGAARGASDQPASTSGPDAANLTTSETVDSIDKGNASEDSGADGRQTLDTFERQHHEPTPQADDHSKTEVAATASHAVASPGSGGHLDFRA